MLLLMDPLYDKKAKVVPIIHEFPLKPEYAPEPAGEWSKLTFIQWLNKR
jgi:hypothetical protein